MAPPDDFGDSRSRSGIRPSALLRPSDERISVRTGTSTTTVASIAPVRSFQAFTSTWMRSIERRGSPCHPAGFLTSTSRSSKPPHHVPEAPPIVVSRPIPFDTFSAM